MTSSLDDPAPGRDYDEFAADFETHAATGAYNALYDRPAVLDVLGDVAGRRVVDLGCGPGLYAEPLVSGGAEVVGLDRSPAMIRLARRRVPHHASFRVHDLAEPLDCLQRASFDRAVMALVIHHLDNRTEVLAEVHRVLRPGGRLIVSTHHPTSDWQRLGGSYFETSIVEETWQRDWAMRYWRQPLGAVCDEFTSAGFVIERLVEPTPTQEMAARFPEAHERLSERPGFIVFSLLKLPREDHDLLR